MANANIDALNAGSLRIKIAYFISEYLTFYKWCVTKVAHCTSNTNFVHVDLMNRVLYLLYLILKLSGHLSKTVLAKINAKLVYTNKHVCVFLPNYFVLFHTLFYFKNGD